MRAPPSPTPRPRRHRSRSSPTAKSVTATSSSRRSEARTTYANGPEILDQNGNVVWFQAVPAGQEASDFRTQTYKGQPVLTWWQGTGLGGLAKGTDYIYNDQYQQIATVNAGNGLSADGHEFLITPQNTALILAYTTGTADLTSIGGPADQTVINGVVQEIDIKTGKVLFEWNSADHVPYSQSEQPLPASASQPWDWFHINAVKLDTDGNLLIDARNTWTAYKVNHHSGHIIWQLGGKASDFKLQAAPGQSLNDAGDFFAWQHDAEAQGNNVYTVFDNESAGVANTGTDATAQYGLSRSVTFKLEHPHGHRDAARVPQPARGSDRAVPGQRADDRRRQPRSSAGAHCPTSRSSTPTATCCTTPGSPTASTPTAPTCCPGARAATAAATAATARDRRDLGTARRRATTAAGVIASE